MIWIVIFSQRDTYIFGAISHPPKCNYNEADLLLYFENCLVTLNSKFSNCTVILGGDFNMLSHEKIVEHTAMLEIVQKTTRGMNHFDRIYVSAMFYKHVKVTNSTVKSDHLAIIAYNGCPKLALNKNRQSIVFRPRKPAQVAIFREVLSKSQFVNPEEEPVQNSFDNFYEKKSEITNKCFPIRRITVTNKDPPFVTPYIKCLLRKKNKLMPNGHKIKADAISTQISSFIVRTNSCKLAELSHKADAQAMWKAV